MAPVDDALDRLYVMADRAAGKDVRAVDLAAITTVSKELEQLREERDEYAERLAWHREERDAYLKGNVWVTRAAEEQARAGAAEAENQRLRGERDNLYENNWPWEWVIATQEKERRQAAEARVRQLEDGLRQFIDHIEEEHPDIERSGGRYAVSKSHSLIWIRNQARALLAASPPYTTQARTIDPLSALRPDGGGAK